MVWQVDDAGERRRDCEVHGRREPNCGVCVMGAVPRTNDPTPPQVRFVATHDASGERRDGKWRDGVVKDALPVDRSYTIK